MAWKRRAQPCPRCNWKFEGEHICFDASKPCPGEGQIDPKKKSAKPRSERARAAVGSRWERYWEEHKERDASLVQSYKDGDGLKQLSERYKVAYATVSKIIRRAEAANNEEIMRRPGPNNRWQREVDDAEAS